MMFSCFPLWSIQDPAIDAAIIGAIATVVAVAIAFVGVLLTIRDNRVRSLQDRMTTLRREAYLEACEVAAESVQFLTSLAGVDVSLASGAPVLRKFDGAASKLHLVAEQPTLGGVMNYVNAFYNEYAAAMNLKYPFERNTADIESAQQELVRLASVPALRPIFDANRQRLQQQIAQLNRQNLDLFARLYEHCSSSVERLAPLVTDATIALRREFDVPLDEVWYRQQMTENMRLNATRWQPLRDSVRDIIERERQALRDPVESNGET
jgi:hypothetical protein